LRKRRRIVPNARYHVIARVNRFALELDRDWIKEMLMVVLKEAKMKYDFSIQSFCIMGNHVHLIIQPGEESSLSKIMQWILSVFAIRFNRAHEINGHFWYDRFKSWVIETTSRFMQLFEYIAKNPVEAEICSRVEEYRYGSIYYLIRGKYRIVDKPDFDLREIFPDIQLI
jgi:putative transposase